MNKRKNLKRETDMRYKGNQNKQKKNHIKNK